MNHQITQSVYLDQDTGSSAVAVAFAWNVDFIVSCCEYMTLAGSFFAYAVAANLSIHGINLSMPFHNRPEKS